MLSDADIVVEHIFKLKEEREKKTPMSLSDSGKYGNNGKKFLRDQINII